MTEVEAVLGVRTWERLTYILSGNMMMLWNGGLGVINPRRVEMVMSVCCARHPGTEAYHEMLTSTAVPTSQRMTGKILR